MSNLAKELTQMFVDQEKSSEMMHEECDYEENYVPQWGKDREPYTRINGYGEELEKAGVSYKVVGQYGGEGQGDDYWAVWEFERNGEVVRFKFEGWYASYNGAEFERVKEVVPVQKTITVWK